MIQESNSNIANQLSSSTSIIITTRMDDTTTWNKQYRLAKFVLIVQFLLTGVEYSIILPTLQAYLRQLHVQRVDLFYGLIYGSFYLSGTIATAIFGRISDVTLRFRYLMVSINAIAALGSTLYLIGYSVALLLLGRFLYGAVEGLYPVTYGELGRCFRAKELDRQAGHITVAFCIGFSIGPGLNLVPTDMQWNLGLVTVRYTNAPGLLLLLAHILLMTLAYFFLVDLSIEKNRILCAEEESIMTDKKDYSSCVSIVTENGKPHSEFHIAYSQELNSKSTLKSPRRIRPWKEVFLSFVKQTDILVLCYGNMVWAYTISSSVVVLPTSAENIVGFKLQEMAYVYICGGIFLSLVMLLSSKIFTYFQDAKISIASFLMSVVGNCCLALSFQARDFNKYVPAILLILYTALFLVSYSFNTILLKTLLSKRVAAEEQAFSQGLFCQVEYVTYILTAVISSYMYKFILAYSGWTIAINVIAAFLFSWYYKLLAQVETKFSGP